MKVYHAHVTKLHIGISGRNYSEVISIHGLGAYQFLCCGD